MLFGKCQLSCALLVWAQTSLGSRTLTGPTQLQFDQKWILLSESKQFRWFLVNKYKTTFIMKEKKFFETLCHWFVQKSIVSCQLWVKTHRLTLLILTFQSENCSKNHCKKRLLFRWLVTVWKVQLNHLFSTELHKCKQTCVSVHIMQISTHLVSSYVLQVKFCCCSVYARTENTCWALNKSQKACKKTAFFLFLISGCICIVTFLSRMI